MTTPRPKYAYLDLRIERALLPHWYDEVRKVAVDWVRRFAVLRTPTETIVRCELERDDVDGFQDALQAAWDDFGYGLT